MALNTVSITVSCLAGAFFAATFFFGAAFLRAGAAFFGCLDKKNQPVQPVGIGQGQSFHAQVPGRPAEFIDGPDSPAFGVMGMNV